MFVVPEVASTPYAKMVPQDAFPFIFDFLGE
jgi:hypothetical protein